MKTIRKLSIVVLLLVSGCFATKNTEPTRIEIVKKVIPTVLSTPYACMPNADDYELIEESEFFYRLPEEYNIAFSKCMVQQFQGYVLIDGEEADFWDSNVGIKLSMHIQYFQAMFDKVTVTQVEANYNSADDTIVEFEVVLKFEKGDFQDECTLKGAVQFTKDTNLISFFRLNADYRNISVPQGSD